ncbi:helix-turn-helix domain-containing protein [Catellatospora tritici]|uniref:helix-turn-helix domain-containing protein n=1 Tax=Catellatospora tritici TaxID=2851566 RepID=UPI001C2CF213|nr:helix-turn-helix domain-containing protein [Catellatospora tritici]MBV1852712.1 helix-turn-helix domain-containing protein [Catellatospora tritici]
MIEIEFGAADLVDVRFAHSPMVEVVTSTMVLTRRTDHWLYAAWRERTAPLFTAPELAVLRAVVSGPCYIPDFLTPVLPTARPSLDDELAAVAATPLDRVAFEVQAAWAGHAAPPEAARFDTDPATALAELVGQVRHYFTQAIAPVWPRLRAAVEAELAHRARTAADDGPRTLLAGLHPRLDWDGSALLLASAKSRQWTLDGHRLALLPTGFAGSVLHTMTEAVHGRALWYAPRGYGGMWDAEVPQPAEALAALLGPTRAAVLSALAVPASTGEIAATLGLAPATASHHLTTLRDSGLVAAERTGRRLRYRRTTVGEQLT